MARPWCLLAQSRHCVLSRYNPRLLPLTRGAHFCLNPMESIHTSSVPHRATIVRISKEREIALDGLVPVVAASSPFGLSSISVVVEEPKVAYPRGSSEHVEPTIDPPTSESVLVDSLLGSYRLAGLLWLSTLYRSSNAFLPSEIQLIANWIASASHAELSEMVTKSSANGKALLHHLVKSILPSATVATASPPFPIFSASALVSSLVFSAGSQVSTISLAMTLEAARLPLGEAVSPHSEVSRTGHVLQWLLDESKLQRNPSCDLEIRSLLRRSIVSLSSYDTAASFSAATCSAELKQSTKPVHPSRESAIEVVLTIPRLTLVFAAVGNLQNTLARCKSVLLPLLSTRMGANQSRQLAAWPEGVPVPSEVSIPSVARPVNENAVAEFTAELELIEKAFRAYGTIASSMSVEGLNSHMVTLSELSLRCSVLELSMAIALLEDDEIDCYNSAVSKALKKKKNVSSQLHYGRPLQRFVSEIGRQWRSEMNSCATLHLALKMRCEGGAVLSLTPFLSTILSPQNQEARRPKVAKGALDTEPKQMVIREHVFDLIRNTFCRYGAVAIDTPVFELRETLTGKYGEDQKLIFDLKDQGGEQLCLRYDLTVPFARYCATQSVEKIKRFHIGKVYRRDEPQMKRGRFREFYQCDFDIAGLYDPMVADVEVLSVLVDILSALKGSIGSFEVKLNHRGVLDALMATCGVPKESFKPICSAIDKLDKMSWEDVKQEMCEAKGLPAEVADKIHQFVSLRGKPFEVLAKLESLTDFRSTCEAEKCLSELRTLFGYLGAAGIESNFVFDLSLARGLDYYTGVIFEAVLVDESYVGSVAAGGRYDRLVGMFSGRDIPAVGVSIGVERLFRIIEKNLGLAEAVAEDVGERETSKTKQARESVPKTKHGTPELKDHQIDVFVCSIGDKLLCDRLKICKTLRDAGIAADFYYADKIKLGKQMTYANDRGIQIALIFGEDELKRGTVKLRRFKYGQDKENESEEIEVSAESMVDEVRSILSASKSLKTQALELVTCSNNKLVSV